MAETGRAGRIESVTFCQLPNSVGSEARSCVVIHRSPGGVRLACRVPTHMTLRSEGASAIALIRASSGELESTGLITNQSINDGDDLTSMVRHSRSQPT